MKYVPGSLGVLFYSLLPLHSFLWSLVSLKGKVRSGTSVYCVDASVSSEILAVDVSRGGRAVVVIAPKGNGDGDFDSTTSSWDFFFLLICSFHGSN